MADISRTAPETGDVTDNRLNLLNPDWDRLIFGTGDGKLSDPDRLQLFFQLAISGNLRTTAPLLPLVLNWDGVPYHIQNHFLFEPMFDVDLPRKLTLMAARQIGKSLSLSAKAVFMCAVKPNFKQLFVTPLSEQVRRLSSNYVRPLIEDSSIRDALTSAKSLGSVLQRDFKNRSKLFFSFAGLTVGRTRGLNPDCVNFDESFCGKSAFTRTKQGVKLLKDLSPGEQVLSFDKSGQLCWDTVVNRSYHGYQHCFRITTGSGRSVVATSDSWLATTVDWKRVSNLIELSASNAARYSAGRRKYEFLEHQQGKVQQQSRLEPARVQLSEVHRFVRVRKNSTREIEEQRLRNLVKSVLDCSASGAILLEEPVLPGWPEWPADEVYQPAVARPDRRRGFGLVDKRRRKHAAQNSLHPDTHRGVQRAGSKTAESVVIDEVRRDEHGCIDRQQEQTRREALVHNGIGSRHYYSYRPDQTVHTAVHGLQTGSRAAGRHPDLSLVPDPVQADEKSTQASFHCGNHIEDIFMRVGGVPEDCEEDGLQEVRIETLFDRGQKSTGKGGVSRRSGSSQGEGQEISSDQPGTAQRAPERAEAETTRLVESNLVRIEYVGKRHVYDIETEKHHAFIVNGIAGSNSQDHDPDHVDIIEESMSASPYKMSQFSGTALSNDTMLHGQWERSSQAEWIIPCHHCNRENVPALDYHLDKMIGPYREDISIHEPGLICYHRECRRPIDPTLGRWRHRIEGRRGYHDGYHMPQFLFPMHYGSAPDWRLLLSKREIYGAAKFYNEVCGVSYDFATKMVTQTELIEAGCLHENTEQEALQVVGNYRLRVLAADWGGGGEKGVSLTCPAVLGLTPGGTIDVIYARKLPNPMDHIGEARECRRLFDRFRCHIFAHDYTGAGHIRETVMIQSGLPRERIMPMWYMGHLGSGMMRHIKATPQSPRAYYELDKTQSLQNTCYSIKLGGVRFFKYDHIDAQRPGLLHDFLALVEEKSPRAYGSDRHIVHKKPNQCDDFAQAVNMGCCAIWYTVGGFPDFSQAKGVPAASPATIEPLPGQEPYMDNREYPDDYGMGGMGGGYSGSY